MHSLFKQAWVRIATSLPLLTAGSLGLSLSGCSDSTQRDIERIQTSSTVSKERKDSIREAFKYLPQLIRMNRMAALREIRYQLNTWSKSVNDASDWSPPSVLESISPSLRTIDFSNRMKELDFGEPECEYLLQCQILTELSKWVIEKPYRDELFKNWLTAKMKELDSADAHKLETTLKLFDWTVRNIAIEGNPKDVEQLTTNPELPLSDNGQMYRQLPWQTLMFARGEVWQRARVFTQLLFAQGIDSVVLALPSRTGATENASIRPWVVAIPIGNELYLFEPNWGLPIPSVQNNGIATLNEAKSNADVLRRAKVPGLFEYPVESKDLNNLVALIDCEPFAVGRSMHTLERSLTGENRMRLSTDADSLESKLNQIAPNMPVRLWNVPWLAHVYNQSVRQRLEEQSAFSIRYLDQHGVFIIDTPMSRARQLHFKGQFDSKIEAVGALRTYMDFRVDEQTLKELLYDKEIQRELGIMKGQFEKQDMFERRVEQARGFIRRSKFDIGIFLAMANFDLAKDDTAIDWLTKRLLDQPGTDRWHAQAHYLLGRLYEETKQFTEAEEQYKFEASPQSAGNRIRLRKLRQSISSNLSDPAVN